MRSFLQDVRFVLRQLVRNPGFAALVILTLALGIGGTTAVFSVLHGVLLRPSPYAEPRQLVFLTPERLAGGAYSASASGVQFAEWEGQATSFAALAAYDWTFNFLIHPDGNESLEGMVGSAALFRVLGLRAELGRAFTDQERSLKDHPVVVIGHGLWERRFGSDTNIVGKIIHLSRLPPLTVVGVMPPGVRFLPSRTSAQEPNYNLHALVDYWLPDSPNPGDRRHRDWNIVARLKPDLTVRTAQAEMTALAARQAQSDPELNGITATVTSLDDVLSGEIRRVLFPLFGAVCFVLLIACANVSGLLLVRGLARRRELAVRAALGAGWLRLLRLALTESLLLALFGAMVGSLLAVAAIHLLLVTAPNSIPRLDQVGVDSTVFGFTVGVSFLTGLGTGLLPAWQVLKPNLNVALKESGRSGSHGPGHRRVLSLLVASEVSLTLVLLIGAGLMLQTMARLSGVNPGYQTENILTMVVTTLGTNWHGFHQQALESVSALPGVKSAAFVWGLPLTGNKWMTELEIDGREQSRQLKDKIAVPLRSVSPDYFKLMGIALMAGRDFTDREGTNLVAIVNQTLVGRHFPNESAIGKRIRWGGGGAREIVGIVSDLETGSLGAPAEPEVYLPFFQAGAYSKHLVLRTTVDPRRLMAMTRSELRRIDPGVVVEEMKTMARIRADSVAAQQFAMTLITAFSVAALVLSVVGIYGVMSHSVWQRTQEIGIRMALGAQREDVLRLMLRQAIAPTATGLAFGLAGALGLTRLLRGLLFGVSSTDPVTFVALPVLLAAVALLACWVPARRATRVDPMEALRNE